MVETCYHLSLVGAAGDKAGTVMLKSKGGELAPEFIGAPVLPEDGTRCAMTAWYFSGNDLHFDLLASQTVPPELQQFASVSGGSAGFRGAERAPRGRPWGLGANETFQDHCSNLHCFAARRSRQRQDPLSNQAASSMALPATATPAYVHTERATLFRVLSECHAW